MKSCFFAVGLALFVGTWAVLVSDGIQAKKLHRSVTEAAVMAQVKPSVSSPSSTKANDFSGDSHEEILEYACSSGDYKPIHWDCDGDNDCLDGSDEKNCSNTFHCASNEFQCDSGQCILQSLVCDKTLNCKDSSDEKNCGIEECAKIRGSQCRQKCVSNHSSSKCTCNAGYTPMPNGKACRDINECLEVPGVCDQNCLNTIGSNICSCNSTYYILASDNKSCTRKDALEPWLILSNKYYIRNLTTDGKDIRLVKSGLNNVVSMDLDVEKGRIYYVYWNTNNKTGFIARISNTSEEQTAEFFIEDKFNGDGGLAVDWIGKKIYWSNGLKKHIAVAELDGTRQMVLLRSGLRSPGSLAVHPGNGYIYFTDTGLTPFIARVGMDGTMFKRIVLESIAVPAALTIDHMTNRLIWADSRLNVVEMADMDGRNRIKILSGYTTVPSVWSLAVLDGYLYWVDVHIRAIFKAKMFSDREGTIIRNMTNDVFDIKIWHPIRQPAYENPCKFDNGGCSHLCLLSPGTTDNVVNKNCACPDSFYLLPDRHNCSCSADKFYCGKPDDKCIPIRYKCDGENNCRDGSDEGPSCLSQYCPPDQFECTNKICKAVDVLCNGMDECGDNSDEANCSMPCHPWEFRCTTTGLCIPLRFTCDGGNDCRDLTDETPDLCKSKSCDQDLEFKCKSSGYCIEQDKFCDGNLNCNDGSDEPTDHCQNRPCKAGWSRCQDSNSTYRCFPSWKICDGKPDCFDGWDELPLNCPNCTARDGFQCRNGKCVPQKLTCDFDDDCGDRSDEDPTLCQGRYRECSAIEFKCKNEKCILDKLVCNKEDDCGDKSDELNCTCSNEQFQCANGTCIQQSYVCNRNDDCGDMSDERNCSAPTIAGTVIAPTINATVTVLAVAGTETTPTIAGAVTATGLILILGSSLLLLHKLKKWRVFRRTQNRSRNSRRTLEMDTLRFSTLMEAASTGNDEFDSLLIRYTRLLEVSREVLEISEIVLGRGEFGIIFKGLAHELPTVLRGPTTVAVKTIINSNDVSQQKKFAEELKIMTKLGRNINVINLLGIVLDENLLLLLEYCGSGSLLSFLRERRSGYVYEHVDENGSLLPFLESEMRSQCLTTMNNEGRAFKEEEDIRDYMLSTNDLIRFAHQVSRGMEYLVSRSIIHRDLAARNVLVADHQILKISDFGLAKHGQLDYIVSNMLVPLPVLWMPPEAILTGAFSQKSDVWSFGVLLWETFSLGERPFNTPNVANFSANAFARWLLEGHQMERPSGLPSRIYEVMQLCWSLRSEDRPIFRELRDKMDQFLVVTFQETNYLPVKDSNMQFTEEYEEILRSLSEINIED